MPHRPVTLITGASSGIGEALADLLAEAGHDLVLVARRQDRLENAASRLRARGATVEVLVADLADEAGLNRAITRAGQNDIDLLINNAGAGGYAPLATVSPSSKEATDPAFQAGRQSSPYRHPGFEACHGP